jgi:hypothetical protein
MRKTLLMSNYWIGQEHDAARCRAVHGVEGLTTGLKVSLVNPWSLMKPAHNPVNFKEIECPIMVKFVMKYPFVVDDIGTTRGRKKGLVRVSLESIELVLRCATQ